MVDPLEMEQAQMSLMMIFFTMGQGDKFWEQFYVKEITDMLEKDSMEDQLSVLSCWFGQKTCTDIISIMATLNTGFSSPILDVGTGNGHMCRLLTRVGFKSVCGVDCSDTAIKLCDHLASEMKVEDDVTLRFLKDDVVHGQLLQDEAGSFAIINDKGTLDTVAMSVGKDEEDPVNQYLFAILRLLQPNGYYIVTTCTDVDDVEEFCEDHKEETGDEPYTFTPVTEVKSGDVVIHVFQKTPL